MPFPQETIEGICQKSVKYGREVLAEHFRIYGAKLAIRHPHVNPKRCKAQPS